MPFTTKLWNFLSVASYDWLNAVASSRVGFACAASRALHVKESPRSSHMRPSVAVRFFSPFSFTTSNSSVEDFSGAASYRARTFCRMGIGQGNCTSHRKWSRPTVMFPFKSLWTAVKAADPRRSRARSDASHLHHVLAVSHQKGPRRPGQLQGKQECRRQRR